MALSGTESYNSTAGDLITDAFRLIGVTAPWETPNSESTAVGLRYLNLMIKDWIQDDVHLWTQHEGALLLDYNTTKYTFPNSSLTGGDDGIINEDDLIATTLSADFASSISTVTVESNTGITIGSNIFIVLDDGTRFFTTVANVSGNDTVVLNSPLTGDASEGAIVYSYLSTVNLFNPREIYNVRVRDKNGVERSLVELSRSDYSYLSQKAMNGVPTQYYIDTQLDNKIMYIYMVPTDITDTIRFTYIKALDDVTQLTQNVNFPQEWQLTIMLNLAVMLADPYGRKNAIGTRNDPDSIAGRAFDGFIKSAAYSDPNTAIQFNPSWRPY